MFLYISHGADRDNPDWFIVEPRDSPHDQAASLLRAGRTVYMIEANPFQKALVTGAWRGVRGDVGTRDVRRSKAGHHEKGSTRMSTRKLDSSVLIPLSNTAGAFLGGWGITHILRHEQLGIPFLVVGLLAMVPQCAILVRTVLRHRSAAAQDAHVPASIDDTPVVPL